MLHDPKNDLPQWKVILLKAHAILEQGGWKQGSLHSGTCAFPVGPFCIEGAIAMAVGKPDAYGYDTGPDGIAAMSALYRAIHRSKTQDQIIAYECITPKTIWPWNDFDGRTEKEVLGVLSDAIAEPVEVEVTA